MPDRWDGGRSWGACSRLYWSSTRRFARRGGRGWWPWSGRAARGRLPPGVATCLARSARAAPRGRCVPPVGGGRWAGAGPCARAAARGRAGGVPAPDRARAAASPPGTGAPAARRGSGSPARARRLAFVLAARRGGGARVVARPAARRCAEAACASPGSSSVVVQPGDTLWSIASRWPVSGDVREVDREIRGLNGLSGADLVPGQILAAAVTGRAVRGTAALAATPAERVTARAPQRRQPTSSTLSTGAFTLCARLGRLRSSACQAPWKTEQQSSAVSPRRSRSTRAVPGGRVSCSAGGTTPTAPARCGCGWCSAASRRRPGPTWRRCGSRSATSRRGPWRPRPR